MLYLHVECLYCAICDVCDVDDADGVIVCIGHVKLAISRCETCRFVELRTIRHAILEACLACPGECLHLACLWVEHFDAIIVCICKVDMTIDKTYSLYMLQEGLFSYAAGITEVEEAGSDERGDLFFACQGDSSHRARLAICYVQHTAVVERQAVGLCEEGFFIAAIAECFGTCTGKRLDDTTLKVQHENAVRTSHRDVEIITVAHNVPG